MVCMCGVLWVQLVFEEYLERAKEKDEKEAKKRRRLADDFTNLLRNTKVERAWSLERVGLVGFTAPI